MIVGGASRGKRCQRQGSTEPQSHVRLAAGPARSAWRRITGSPAEICGGRASVPSTSSRTDVALPEDHHWLSSFPLAIVTPPNLRSLIPRLTPTSNLLQGLTQHEASSLWLGCTLLRVHQARSFCLRIATLVSNIRITRDNLLHMDGHLRIVVAGILE